SYLFKICPNCTRFFFNCNGTNSFCHHSKVVFTDGACINNGRRGVEAFSGMGFAIGDDESQQYQLGIDDYVDDGPRTNQRAELLAAIHGLELLGKISNKEYEEEMYNSHPDDIATLVLATDSEYIVKGITEWYHIWERQNWLTNKGFTPVNLDLFHRLQDCVKKLEQDNFCVVFFHVSHDYNTLADGLAKDAAESMRGR
ncbi:ribonuclease H-like protein, partial [Gymnopus androsaceus JB14]